MDKRRGISLRLYTVDAFTNQPFSGNPAAVCLDDTMEGLDDELMQMIAAEMNISETAFIRGRPGNKDFVQDSEYGLRWFTPTNEVPLCGHATLASSAVLFHAIGNQNDELSFNTLSGKLKARREGDAISMDFPLNPPQPQDSEELSALLQLLPLCEHIFDLQYSPSTKKLLVRLHDNMTRKDLEEMTPDISGFVKAQHSGKIKGVIVCLRGSLKNGCVDGKGQAYDFVSRFFAPWNGIPEDPVTGSAHTVLAPYWSSILNKKELYARQCSARGGTVRMRIKEDDRVDLVGMATILLTGQITV